jgi:hypothetical protein
MEPAREEQRSFPRQLRSLGQLLWAVVWLCIVFSMFLCGLCGLNFVLVGLLAFFIDLGDFGPRFSGETVQTIAGKFAFTFAGVALAMASAVFFRLALRGRYLAAVIFYGVLSGLFAVVDWSSGIHSIAGGIGRVGQVERR